MKHRHVESPVKSILFSLIVVFTGLGLMEGILRWIVPQPGINRTSGALPFWVLSNLKDANFIRDPLLFWRVPPSTKRLHTNSRGLIGPEFSVDKEPGVFRVITLGDSCTWGFGVKFGYEYPNVLGYLLNQTLIPAVFEVENAGVPGYSSLQALRYLKSDLIRYRPDVVTVCLGRNDRRELSEEGGYAPDHEVPVSAPWVDRIRSFLNRFRSYQLLRSLLLGFQGVLEDRSLRESGHGGRTWRVEAVEFEGNIREIFRTVRSNGAVPVAITSPVYPAHVGNYNDLLRKICTETGTRLLDAETEFNRMGAFNLLIDDCHPNPEGHRWLAERLAEIVLDIRGDHSTAISEMPIP